MSVVKCAENGNGLVCRFYNPNLAASVAIPALENAHCVLLDEQTPAPERRMLKPNDVQTLYIEIA